MPRANTRPRRLRLAFNAALFLLVAASFLGARGPGRPQDDEWRRNNNRGNRYEGLISVPTGKSDLDVLAFSGYWEPFKGDVTLKVKFFYPGQGRLSLVARELDDQNHYWMEAKPWGLRPGDWNEFHPWPTRDVIVREGIEPTNLGVLIKLDGDRLLPAFTYHTRVPDGVGKYVMQMVSNKSLSGLTFTLAPADGDNSKGRPKTWPMVTQSPDTPFPVTLDVRGFAEGFLRLSVERRLRDSPQPQPRREFVFYHKPSARR